MIIAGPCLMVKGMEQECIETAKLLKQIKQMEGGYFRCKIWGGGTTPEKWNAGIGNEGIVTIGICNAIIPAMTEIQTDNQLNCLDIVLNGIGNKYGVWIGARNSQNYGLLQDLNKYKCDIWIKRGLAMSIDETIGLYDIMAKIIKKPVNIIERGTAIIDREPDSKWGPDLKGVIRIKHERPDIFDGLVVDCSHSVFRHDYVKDVYDAFKAIGVKHFMFEAIRDKTKAVTDTAHVLSVDELEKIIS